MDILQEEVKMIKRILIIRSDLDKMEELETGKDLDIILRIEKKGVIIEKMIEEITEGMKEVIEEIIGGIKIEKGIEVEIEIQKGNIMIREEIIEIEIEITEI